MLFILFGTRTRTKVIGEGKFVCPFCRNERQYEHRKAKMWFTLYFIPVIPLKSYGEYIQCQTCGRTFEPVVLNQVLQKSIQKQGQRDKEPLPVDLLNNMPALLEQGMPVEYWVRDVTKTGLERAMALQMVDHQFGKSRAICNTCGLTYTPHVQHCKSCGQELTTIG